MRNERYFKRKNNKKEYYLTRLRSFKQYPARIRIALAVLSMKDYVAIYISHKHVRASTSLIGRRVSQPLMVVDSLRKILDSVLRFIRNDIPRDVMDKELNNTKDSDDLKELSDRIYKGEV